MYSVGLASISSSEGRRPSPSRRSTRLARGFSLLEALVATGFLSVALLAFASNSISLTRTEKTADSVSAAAALAQEKLEQLRSRPVGAPEHVQGSYADAANVRADGTTGSGAAFTRRWTVSAGNQPSNGLKTVIVEISWRDSRPHVTRLAAYVRCHTIPCT